MYISRSSSSSAFTLIELLVVIAIIAILSVVVILTLNPAELLRQSRDSNRLADMATLTDALNIYNTDQAGASSYSLGNASDTYPSTYDPNATSTAGGQCQGLGMLSLNTSTGQQWQCSASSTYKKTNDTGWLPVNFSNIAAGSPIGALPVDPTNQTSTGLFYAYNTNGSQFEVTAALESQKYKIQYGAAPQTSYFPEVISGGNPTVSALYNPTGLVGWWPFSEGSGTVANDQSGNGNNGTWSGATSTNGTYYTGGKVGPYAGDIVSNPGGVSVPASSAYNLASFSAVLWVNPSSAYQSLIADGLNQGGTCGSGNGGWDFQEWQFTYCNGSNALISQGSFQPSLNVWHQFAVTFVSNGTVNIYVDGALSQSYSVGTITYYGTPLNVSLGAQQNMYNTIQGYIDDVRIYNRALSAAEVKALYNSQR